MKCILYPTQIQVTVLMIYLSTVLLCPFLMIQVGVVFQFHSSVQQTRTRIEINSLWVVGHFSDIKYTIGRGH